MSKWELAEAVAVVAAVAAGVTLASVGCLWAGLGLCNLAGLTVVLSGDDDEEEED